MKQGGPTAAPKSGSLGSGVDLEGTVVPSRRRLDCYVPSLAVRRWGAAACVDLFGRDGDAEPPPKGMFPMWYLPSTFLIPATLVSSFMFLSSLTIRRPL
jgi:hypothetical protein